MNVILDGIPMINLIRSIAVFYVGARMHVLPKVGKLKLPGLEGGTRP